MEARPHSIGVSGSSRVEGPGLPEGHDGGAKAEVVPVDGGEGSDRGAERVASHEEGVSGVGRDLSLDDRRDLGRELAPGEVEALADLERAQRSQAWSWSAYTPEMSWQMSD